MHFVWYYSAHCPFSFVNILMSKRELVVLLLFWFCCHVAVSVLCLFLALPCVGLWSLYIYAAFIIIFLVHIIAVLTSRKNAIF